MAKEKRSFSSCFFLIIALAVILIAVLLASMDWIKERLGLEKPDSAVGRKIDESIPHIAAVQTYEEKVKPGLQLVEMKTIKDAYATYYILNDRWAESLEQLVDGGQIDQGKLTDLYGHRYLFLPVEQDAYLVCSGRDRIRNTADDLAVSLRSPGLELGEEEKETIARLVAESAISATD